MLEKQIVASDSTESDTHSANKAIQKLQVE